MPRILDGRALAAARGEALRPRIALLRARLGRPPGLGVLLVGDDPAAQIYVRNKARAAAALGMASRLVRLPATAPAAVVLAAVEALNRDHEVDAFLVQLPLPAPLVAAPVIAAIAPGKDADGLLPSSLGRLLADLPGPRPCTPAAIMALLASVPVDLAGAHAVVLGRSAIVGRPAGLMLLQADATVTLCHALSRDVAAHARAADVLVEALPLCERMVVTEIAKAFDCDAFFPPIDTNQWKETAREAYYSEHNGCAYAFVTYQRI